MRGVQLYNRVDWGKVRNELRAFRAERDAEFILLIGLRLVDNWFASLVDRASFWSCRMFHPRHYLSPSPLIAVLMACAGSAAGDVRLPISCPSSPSSCRPLTSVHSASTLVADGTGGAYLVWMDGELHSRVLRLRPDLTVANGWPAEGLVLAPELSGSHHIHPALAADGEGGVYVAWIEQDEDLDLSLRVQRLRGDGRPEAGWPSAGVRVEGPSSYV